jgi:septal ring factor EnvC (AmiA/AmiB activator)
MCVVVYVCVCVSVCLCVCLCVCVCACSSSMLNTRLKEEVQAERAALQAGLERERERFLGLAKAEAALRAQHDGATAKLKKAETDVAELRGKLSASEAAVAHLHVELKVAQEKSRTNEHKMTE